MTDDNSDTVKIYCGVDGCDTLMTLTECTDDLQGNIREYYTCPKCGHKVWFIVATDED